MLKKIQEDLKLPTTKIPSDVVTRWNSTYHMLQAALVQIPVLRKFKEEMNARKKHFPPLPSSEQFARCSKLLPVLKIFDDETNKLSEEKCIASCYIPTLTLLMRQLGQIQEDFRYFEIEDIVKSMINSIAQRFVPIEHNTLLCMCMAIDPRFKGNLLFKSKSEWAAIEENLIEFGWKWHNIENIAQCAISDDQLQTTLEQCSNITTSSGSVFSNELPIEERGTETSNQEIYDEFGDDADETLFIAQEGLMTQNFDIWDAQNLIDQTVDENAQNNANANDEPNNPKIKYCDELKIEFVHFKQLPNLKPKENVEKVFEWFAQKQFDFPKICSIARKLLSIPCSSVSSERLFSQATLLYSNKLRNRLSGEKAEEILLIKSSLKKLKLGQGKPLSDDEDEDEIEE